MTSAMGTPPAQLPKLAGSMTTKEWVIPPRPKPGRKPATDTPPTKRKAQNRAAQRAFRERRAARVNELEDQLDEQKEENERKEAEYKERICHLEMEVQSHKSRCEVLQNLLDQERKDRVKAETELDRVRRRLDSQGASGQFPPARRTSVHPASLGNLSSVYQSSMGSHGHSPAEQVNMMENSPPGDFTCGPCGSNGRCACAETVIKSVEAGCGKCGSGNRCDCVDGPLQSTLPELKRARLSPAMPLMEKRQRSDWNADDSAIEIDFTSYFKKPQPPSLQAQTHQPPSISSGPVHDPCGFCKEGDYCVCAEAAPFSQQTQTPPPETDAVASMPMPMEIDSNGAVKLRPRQSAAASSAPAPKSGSSRSCGPSGPGTCAQCIADPVSGLFCRALSSNMNRQGANTAGGCCGGGGGAGGCCKSGNATSSGPKAEEARTGPGLSLSCAEAYQTLSSHRNFSKATDDIGSWLPKLRAAPRAGVTLPSPTASSRLPIEVEAASIMSVLKDFDIRFGRGL
ncbi:hypothetical protein ACRALDRAFT_1064594 [Sodiomyces alcalophilus JCM 7366]|uniref:uncharacterized protein n=1 Tax=Sodiomyces alcalophilus JCM 7366 TaxID=591952 RepID=UPI0039B385A3